MFNFLTENEKYKFGYNDVSQDVVGNYLSFTVGFYSCVIAMDKNDLSEKYLILDRDNNLYAECETDESLYTFVNELKMSNPLKEFNLSKEEENFLVGYNVDSITATKNCNERGVKSFLFLVIQPKEDNMDKKNIYFIINNKSGEVVSKHFTGEEMIIASQSLTDE